MEKYLASLIISASLVGCGGGSGDSDDLDRDVNSIVVSETALTPDTTSTPVPLVAFTPAFTKNPDRDELIGSATLNEYDSFNGITARIVDVVNLDGNVTMDLLLVNTSPRAILFTSCNVALMDENANVEERTVPLGGLFTQINPNDRILGRGEFPVESFDSISSVDITCEYTSADENDVLDILNGPLEVSFMGFGIESDVIPTIRLKIENTSGDTFNLAFCDVKTRRPDDGVIISTAFVSFNGAGGEIRPGEAYESVGFYFGLEPTFDLRLYGPADITCRANVVQ